MSFDICPIDGRYRNTNDPLREYFSEFGLMRCRYFLEIDYLFFFLKIIGKECPNISKTFDINDFLRIKEIEKETNHDVKAIEYYLREKIGNEFHNFIHFGLTSHDIDNVSVILNVKSANENVMFKEIDDIINILHNFYQKWGNTVMLSHTHGQPASPTTIGKEMEVFTFRLQKRVDEFKNLKYHCKFGGAVGNLNAHKSVFPDIDWIEKMDSFINSLNKNEVGILCRDRYTTQLSNYDDLTCMLSIYQRINTILIDLCQDIWLYISLGYFKLAIVKNEVGSSTMPHKVNPIQFENAEGNLGLANALIQHLEIKLPVSRLQRDLTDSTVTRNIGVIYGYMLQALSSIKKGLNKLDVDEIKLKNDLDKNYVVVSEALLTHLRMQPQCSNPYEKLKTICRTHDNITADEIETFIDSLNVSSEIKAQLKQITPHNYCGYN